MSVRLVVTTVPPADADRIADALVEARVAACVSIIAAVRSRYRWQGAVVAEEEAMLLCKAEDDRIEALRTLLRTLHPYTVPEIVVLAPEAVEEAYAAWVRAETRAPSTDGA